MFTAEVPSRRLDDVVIPARVRHRLDTALARVRFHTELYQNWNLQSIDPTGVRVAINFFGPPGTGKSLCAEATAAHLGRTIIRVNYADIESKYVGETPKNITTAFRRARDTNSVLFFDEADSILGKRLSSVTQSADHGVNVSRSVMLLELDKFEGIVLFATNLASNYDAAFVRRILAHIQFELPDLETRRRLWERHLPRELPLTDDVSPTWLAAESESLSGGDIRTIVIASASRAVQRVGSERRVSSEDFLVEIGNVRVAQREIGRSGARTVESVLRADELPADARATFDARSAHSAIAGETHRDSE